MVQTEMKKEEKTETVTYPFSSLDDKMVLDFTIQGQCPERSYEDRSVYFKVESRLTSPMGEREACMGSDVDFNMWLNGENAIELGLKLIEHGNFALEANRVQHQQIHVTRQFQKYLDEERVEEVVFEMIDDNPINYGDGFKMFKITPVWVDGMAPQYDEDFVFERVIYWSPNEDFHDQLDRWTRGVSYSFVNYDHDFEVRVFQELVKRTMG